MEITREGQCMIRIITKLLIVTCLSALSFGSLAQYEDPFIGTWDLDKAASNFGNALPPNNLSRTYQYIGDNTYMYIVVTISDEGTIGGSSATYKFDEKEYVIGSLTPQAGRTTISYKKLNEKTVEYTVRIDGRVSQIGAKTISPNGSVLTIAIQNFNAQGNVNNQILSFKRRR
jgi:hypothetical protein